MTDEQQPIESQTHFEKEPEINKYFKAVIKANASDLHLKVGQTPKLRIGDDIRSTTGEELSIEKIEELVFEILTDKQKQFFIETGTINLVYEISPIDRFRVSIFRQRTKVSLAARRITSTIPPFETLHLPGFIQKMADNSYAGLILVTGPSGCGKSTTIASMIDRINRSRSCHIITVEDPLEFIHTDKKAIVSQREIGIDVKDYDDALKSLTRQDPDVVLIGDMANKEAFSTAMRIAERGCLVFGSLHSSSAAQTIQRVLDLYPAGERHLARQSLATTFRAIINQNLLPGIKKDALRVPSVEILLANSIIRKMILEERDSEIEGVIKDFQNEGMQDIIESLHSLVAGGWIDVKVALQYAPNVDELKMALKGIRARS
ncbi:MAG: PilT/PilU family type 4a pilus ATPase [Sedimentisphaerales bacterium]|nr:PilT/PilU family type 4a pilus ATPase [Sedimentisphaerales bacterium]